MTGTIKVLSLLQPWATLVAEGLKRVETRSWSTSYRGPIAIHATKKFTRSDWEMIMVKTHWARPSCIHAIRRALTRAGYTTHQQFPTGCIVALADLVACRSTAFGIESMLTCDGHPIQGYEWMDKLSEDERAFGDYGPNRWGWFLENVRRLEDPIPARGALGLWDFPADQLEGI